MNNIIVMESCLQEFKSKNEIVDTQDSEVFELFSILQITKDMDLSFSEIEDSIVDGGRDGGIDSVITLIDETYIADIEEIEDIEIAGNSTLSLFISQSKFEKSFKENALDKLHISIPSLFNLLENYDDLLGKFNPKLVEKIMIFREAWLKFVQKGKKPRIHFSYICKANTIEKNSSFDLKMEQVKQITKDSVIGGDVEFHLYSSEELIKLYQKQKNSTRVLRFKENPIPVSFNDTGYGYLGVVSLNDYYKFITDDNKRIVEGIFESNVRHYQGNVDVNSKIQETLENEYERDFWWLNNGITIISSDCVPSPKALALSNVQIVNGLQTSFTIGNHYISNTLDERSILVKIIVSKDKETIDKVISATNSQTPVSPAILRATEELQRNIELYFLGKGYFYDRRKNYYRNLGKPAKKIFNIQTTAQAVESIMNTNPSGARSGPTLLIKDEKHYEKIFNSRVHLDVYLNCCLLHQSVKNFVSSSLEIGDKNVIKNFLYHLTRIVASFITNKAKYDVNHIIGIDCLSISIDTLEKAYDFLLMTIKEYQTVNPQENIINIAKSKKFGDELNSKLDRTFI